MKQAKHDGSRDKGSPTATDTFAKQWKNEAAQEDLLQDHYKRLVHKHPQLKDSLEPSGPPLLALSI
jgi:CDP-glycerol glycerophosphotransferase (TagB/SpsB family)